MSDLLISEVRLVEKYKLAIPLMEKMLTGGGFYYIAGSLMLSMVDPATGSAITAIDIKPIDDYASDIIRKGQYLASQLFVKHKGKTCYSYSEAAKNILKYEHT